MNLASANDINLIDLYTQAQKFTESKKVPTKKAGKIVKTTRNHQLIDKLTGRRSKGLGNFKHQNLTYEETKKSKDRKPKLETLPNDLTTAISLGTKMITKFNKRSR